MDNAAPVMKSASPLAREVASRAMSRGVNGERPSQTDWPAFCAIDQPPLPMPLMRKMSPTAGCVGKVTVTVDAELAR